MTIELASAICALPKNHSVEKNCEISNGRFVKVVTYDALYLLMRCGQFDVVGRNTHNPSLLLIFQFAGSQD